MRVRFKTNPGTRDFPELADKKPQAGESLEVEDGIGGRLVALGVAECLDAPKQIKAVASEPAITAPAVAPAIVPKQEKPSRQSTRSAEAGSTHLQKE